MNKLLLLALLVLLSLPQLVWSESAPSPVELIGQIKADVTDLLQENYALRAQHDQLKEQYVSLLRQLNEQKDRLEKAGIVSEEWTEAKRKKQKMIEELKTSAAAAQNEILIQESKNSFFKNELGNLDERQKLLDLKYRDAQIQQKEVQMELQLKKLAYENQKNQSLEELENLKENVREKVEEEKQLIRKINELNHQSIDFDAEISQLKEQNAKMEEELANLKRERSFQSKENSILRNKQLLAERSSGWELEKLKKEEGFLKDEVAELIGKKEELNVALTDSLVSQDETRQYLKDVKRIDEENQFLRVKIDELTKKIQTIGY